VAGPAAARGVVRIIFWGRGTAHNRYQGHFQVAAEITTENACKGIHSTEIDEKASEPMGFGTKRVKPAALFLLLRLLLDRPISRVRIGRDDEGILF
jgi:hypothetical protein